MQRQVERVHYNGPQLEAMLVRAQEEYHVAGRGAGKTDGILAERLEYNAFAMPRCMIGMVGPSYYKMLTQFLPKIRKGLERLGYIENLHYFVRSEAPKAWRWDKPISAPFKWDNSIHFKCGSAAQLISQDRPASASGLDLDALVGDEARYLKRQMMEEEVFPAIRGNHGRFGHLSVYGSMVFTTDRPRTPSGRWILDMKDRMDPRAIEAIKSAALEIWKMRNAIRTERLAESTVREYGVRIRRIEDMLNHLRRGTVYYKEWSALDNIHVLGYDYIRKEKERLSDYEFRISILNEPIDRVEGGFYPELDEEKHTYEDHAIDYIEKVGDDWEKLENRDCRHDARLVKTLPIDIAFDYGFSFNCCVIGQLFGDRYSVDNCLYVKAPMKIRHLIEKFHDYYQWHGTRDINFFYDHTAIGGDASRDYTFSEEIIRELTAKGWKVNPVYIGQAPAHHDKYLFWSKLLGAPDEALRLEGLPKVEFNGDNCEPLLLSMSLAPARQLKTRFEKDKTSEGREGDQAEATHLSDAGDTLLWGRLNIGGEDVPMPVGSVYGAR